MDSWACFDYGLLLGGADSQLASCSEEALSLMREAQLYPGAVRNLMEEAQLLPRVRFQPRETQPLPSGSSQSDSGDSPCSGETPVPIEETPYPDSAFNSEACELESQL